MDLNTIQNATISTLEGFLKGNKLELGSGKPSVSISNVNAIKLYIEKY